MSKMTDQGSIVYQTGRRWLEPRRRAEAGSVLHQHAVDVHGRNRNRIRLRGSIPGRGRAGGGRVGGGRPRRPRRAHAEGSHEGVDDAFILAFQVRLLELELRGNLAWFQHRS